MSYEKYHEISGYDDRLLRWEERLLTRESRSQTCRYTSEGEYEYSRETREYSDS